MTDNFRGRIIVHRGDFTISKVKRNVADSFATVSYGDAITVITDKAIQPGNVLATDRGWRLISFDMTLPFEVVGFLAEISSALAENDIPIFAVSSFSTDHILVKKEYIEKTLNTLKNLGFEVFQEE